MDFAEIVPVLEAVGVAEAADEPIDLEVWQEELSVPAGSLCERLRTVEAWGLAVAGRDEGLAPLLLRPGRQYLQVRGDVEPAVLRFLPRYIRDLHARRALLRGGKVMMDEFREALLKGQAINHARLLVPPAFAAAVTEPLALDLFTAGTALLARLSSDEPAGCVAEEIMAVDLIDRAEAWLESEIGEGELDSGATEEAKRELSGLFEFFQDDDVLGLFEMREPADAAGSLEDPVQQQLGVADQRIQAWFEPFSWAAPTGYLGS